MRTSTGRLEFGKTGQLVHPVAIPMKDDVNPAEIDFRSQENATSRSRAHLVFVRGSLALFIKRHHNQSCTLRLHHLRLSQEVGLDRLQRAGLHDGVAVDISDPLE